MKNNYSINSFCFNKSIYRFRKKLICFFKNIYKKSHGDKKIPDLAPLIFEEGLDSYSERLELMLNRYERVREIAITGPYGSGKSTFIKSFEARHPEYYIINITLGEFSESCLNTDNVGSEDKTNKLEISILQQLLYRHIDAEEHGSRFVRAPLKKVSKWKIIPLSAFIFTWFLIVLAGLAHGKEKSIDWILSNLESLGSITSLSHWFASFIVSIPILLISDFYKVIHRVRVRK